MMSFQDLVTLHALGIFFARHFNEKIVPNWTLIISFSVMALVAGCTGFRIHASVLAYFQADAIADVLKYK